MTELNDEQRRAVLHANGPLLVFAGAGSGKTRVITYRVGNLLAEHNVPPYRILAVTFTNKAAGEMRERLTAIAGEGLTRDLWVGTYHATCARLLRRYHAEVGLEKGFVIYDDSDQKAVMGRVLKELDLSDRTHPPKLVLSRIQKQKREGIGPDEVRVDHGFDEGTRDAYAGYQRALLRANAVDFEDLILYALRIAESKTQAGEELRARFHHVLVDEFQDTNGIQYRLVRALSQHTRNLAVVGDDDQSIYSWRGADIRNILGFQHDFPDAAVVKLEQNYRSTKTIVAAALGIIKSARGREPKNLWSAAANGEKVRVRLVRDEREEAAHVVSTIRSERARGIEASDIAVFYRIHAQSRVLEEALRSENIAYQIVGGTKFFDRAEVKNLLSYLRLVDNPRSDADFMRIVNVPARGIGDKTVELIVREATLRNTSLFDALPSVLREGGPLKPAAKKSLTEFRRLMDQLREDALRLSPHDLASRVLEETRYREELEKADNAEADARLENLQELIGSVQEYETDAEQSGQSASLSGYLERVSLVADVDTMKDVPLVTLMTIHGAKGLEFRTVLLTGMEEETFPYRGLDEAHADEMDEERRLAYVAVTRARERLYVTHATSRTLFGRTQYLAPSRFLADLPPELVQREGSMDSAWGRSDRGTSQGRSWNNNAYPSQERRPPPPALAPGQRIVDYDAFDDSHGDEEGVQVRPGSHVFHKRFGKGVVSSVEAGAPPTIVAHFPGFGSRKVRADFLSFE
ncbi:MAG TPA: UvrD-helicase domain-containing protein [Polyangiaceae bacterium]|jgi:DNA helicase-2/ATP-dependent DNA helicase PcrA|nr:UvrD-helicase domain-containing protein [Polyangiaceae bacterium]